MNINLHIERLVLDGLPLERNQGPLVQTAIEAELTRLLTQNGIAPNLQAGCVMPMLNTNSIQLTTGSNAPEIGSQIAGSIYSGIGSKE
jgi:hypothetical protein